MVTTTLDIGFATTTITRLPIRVDELNCVAVQMLQPHHTTEGTYTAGDILSVFFVLQLSAMSVGEAVAKNGEVRTTLCLYCSTEIRNANAHTNQCIHAQTPWRTQQNSHLLSRNSCLLACLFVFPRMHQKKQCIHAQTPWCNRQNSYLLCRNSCLFACLFVFPRTFCAYAT